MSLRKKVVLRRAGRSTTEGGESGSGLDGVGNKEKPHAAHILGSELLSLALMLRSFTVFLKKTVHI